jgi:hypothetical protein
MGQRRLTSTKSLSGRSPTNQLQGQLPPAGAKRHLARGKEALSTYLADILKVPDKLCASYLRLDAVVFFFSFFLFPFSFLSTTLVTGPGIEPGTSCSLGCQWYRVQFLREKNIDVHRQVGR